MILTFGGMASRAVMRYRPDMPGIVIVGAGFAGVGMAIALKNADCHDFVILEKGDDLAVTHPAVADKP